MIKIKEKTIEKPSGSRSQFKVECPFCPDNGRGKDKEKSLSINSESNIYKCHRCGDSGYFGEKNELRKYEKTEKTYSLPKFKNLTDLSDEHLKYMVSRGFTQRMLALEGIASDGNSIVFPYFENGVLVNSKMRSPDKKFAQSPDCKPVMYRLDNICDSKEIIVCEGEIDALSWVEAGYNFATSVNQGAPNVSDKTIDSKLACIRNAFDVFENADVIYLSVDDDPNGGRLRNELVKMFGASKVKIIKHSSYLTHDGKPCKDANSILMSHGKSALVDAFKNAEDVKIEGVFALSEFREVMLDRFRNGQKRGETTMIPDLDKLWTHKTGEVTIWTGYNNEGKSQLLRFLLMLRSVYFGEKVAMYAPEDMPIEEWFTDLVEMYIGKSADLTQAAYKNQMSEVEFNAGCDFINKRFYSVYPEDSRTIDELLERFSYVVRKYGVKYIVLDPYNQIHHKMGNGEREDLYISKFMSKLKTFAVSHDIAVHLVAHQITPKIDKDRDLPMPSVYAIKGGGTFADKADNVIIAWREFRVSNPTDTTVKFITAKIKKQKLVGSIGSLDLAYDRRSNQYTYGLMNPMTGAKKSDTGTSQDIYYSDSEQVDESITIDIPNLHLDMTGYENMWENDTDQDDLPF